MVQPSSLALRHLELFEGLPPEKLTALARECAWRNYENGQRIISREAGDRDVHLLVSGRVRVTAYSGAGRQVTFTDVAACEIFGDIAAIDNGPRSADVFDLSTLGVQNRIHAELLRLARQAGVIGNAARIDPAPKHADIASQVSTYREQVTRELSILMKTGLVGKDGRALLVRDFKRLSRMVEDVRSGA